MDRHYYYFLDKEGRLWHDGTEVTDPRFALLVNRSMQRSAEGFFVRCQGEMCHLEVEDVPYVVQDVAFVKDDRGSVRQIDLLFAGGYREILNPSNLWVSGQNVLYSHVRGGEFTARFTRKAYFKIFPFITQHGSDFYLEYNASRFAIRQPDGAK